jgi:protein phosphatase 2C-like protein
MSTNKPLRWQSFHLHKRDHKAEDYEDAFAAAAKRGRFAVADGASESSFAGLWARLLTKGFVDAAAEQELPDWLKPMRQSWAGEVDDIALPWYGEEKRDQGAFATFLGLAIEKSATKPGGRWKAWAVGDSCLFQVREKELLGAFPVERAAAFGNQPALLCSRAGTRKEPAVQQAKGIWEPGDQLFLMTDALAQWFLQRHEAQKEPWQSLVFRLADAKPDAALTGYIDGLRDRSEMRNDDVTLLAIRL